MSDIYFSLLSERHTTDEVVDDILFTDITNEGEIYTLFRIVRFTHIADNHPDGWTHRANVVRVHEPRIGVALLKIVDRVIVRSSVDISPEQSG